MNINDKQVNIEKISEIPKIPQTIKESFQKEKLVIFVGAGVSRLLGLPSWQELAIKLLNTLFKKKIITYYEYEQLKNFDPKKIFSICESVFYERGKKIRRSLRNY